MGSDNTYVSAREACAALDVNPATLYSYVSRGLVRSQPSGSTKREHCYLAEDIARLVAKKQTRRDPEMAAERTARGTLKWGVPVLESALTLITPNGLYYRGHDALELAQHSTFEAVAALLWDMPEAEALFVQAAAEVTEVTPRTEQDLDAVVGVMIRALTYLQEQQFMETDQMATRLIWTLARSICQTDTRPTGLAEYLAQGWGVVEAAPLINTALILCADHELNSSAFAVRIAASTESSLPHAVIAGLAAFSGAKHGGAATLSAALLERASTQERPQDVVTGLLNHGQRVPGFGHPLYPAGDPRAALLLGLTQVAYAASPMTRSAQTLVEVAEDITGLAPNIDFALAVLEHTAQLPSGSAQAIFAIGRSAGWIAHAMEQFNSPILIRPRAKYVGNSTIS